MSERRKRIKLDQDILKAFSSSLSVAKRDVRVFWLVNGMFLGDTFKVEQSPQI